MRTVSLWNSLPEELVTAGPVGGNPQAQTAPSVEERLFLQPSITLLVFILLPCVVLLILINCFLLLHHFPVLSLKKRGKKRGGVKRGNNPSYRNKQTGHKIRIEPNYPEKSMCESYCGAISQSLEATMALGEGVHTPCDSLQTTREWCHKQNETPLRSFCLYPPHAPSMLLCPSGSSIMSQERGVSWNKIEDGGGGLISYSELETEQNAAPPNTPAAPQMVPGITPKVKCYNKTSTQRKSFGAPFNHLGSKLFDHASSIPLEDTPMRFSGDSSFLGPGMDSDFGVSAGISLHILSSDSDSCSQSWASGMEWDYFDPCYIRKNRLRKENRQNQHFPVICSKQYWV